jgi:hypothetical protein
MWTKEKIQVFVYQACDKCGEKQKLPSLPPLGSFPIEAELNYETDKVCPACKKGNLTKVVSEVKIVAIATKKV